MAKPPNTLCGPAPPPVSYPANYYLDCSEACWPPGMYPTDVWDNCEGGGAGECVWSVYHLWCQDWPSNRLCWYGYSLRYSDCEPVSPEKANFVNDIPRKILYEYNMVGVGAFWKPFMNNTEKKPVFRYANKDSPCNIKIKIDPEYFLP